mgnify:CR=1 FL=1
MIESVWYKRLSVQLIALLTLALLPLGSIALFQTNRIAVEADRTEGLSLLGLTERAARNEPLLIERAVGAGRLLGSFAPDLLDDTDACAVNLSRFVDANPEYSFIGVLPLSGVIDCSSSAQPLDFRDYPNLAEVMAAQQPTIIVNESGQSGEQSVFVISEPFTVNGAFSGFISVSIPHSELPETSNQMEGLGLQELITFNDNGTILTSRSTRSQAAMEMPAGALLSGLSTNQPQTFRATNVNGKERRYSIVTIEGSPAAVMAVWRIGEGAANQAALSVAPILFPLLMWLASMGVAMLAMHTLVLRHLSRIRSKMDAFADHRNMRVSDTEQVMVPAEIESLEKNFAQMSQEIMRDEATLEDALREKGVMVKEIHHRVKNNLQLISSIMNMQIRSAKHDETKAVLRRVQDRVISLATIHRDLYQSQDGGRVNVGALVTEIVENSAELVAVEGRQLDVKTEIQPVMLYPDQAVPLSLLVAEATTNAMKYIGDQPSNAPIIEVRFTQEDRTCLLVISNSIGQSDEQESTGLGSQLMNAFAMQLGGQIDTEHHDDRYTLTLNFTALEFQPEARDY